MPRHPRLRSTPTLAALALVVACDPAPDDVDALESGHGRVGEAIGHDHDHVPEPEPEGPDYFTAPLPDPDGAYDCSEKKDTGYVQGDAFAITVVTVDGKPVEVETANAYIQMQKAAANDGIGLKINSGFRTMAEQQYLYNCYINCNCNNCNLAAKPGYSNHQSGHALDLNTAAPGVNNWLKANAGAWGFKATVPSENWHYEWWGGGPPTDGPCGTPDYDAEFVEQSFPHLEDPPLIIQVGETVDGFFRIRNLGKTKWTQTTFLGTLPKGEPSPLADESWPATIRAARVDKDTPKGEVGRFDLTIRGNTPGDFIQEFKLVDEGEDKMTWFLKNPVAIHVIVVDGPGEPPEFGTTGDTESDGEGSSGGATTDAATSGDASTSASTTAGSDGSTGDGSTSTGNDAPGTSGPVASAGFDAASAGHDASDGCECRTSGSGGGASAVLGLLLAALGRRRRR